MFLETSGVVIRQTKYSEYDKILTIFTKERGKIQAIAKGARRPKSKLMGSTDIFCYSDFLLYSGRNLYNVNQSDTIESFYSIREDIYKLSYAAFIVELVDASVLEEEQNELLFELLVKTLKTLSEKKTDFKKLLLAFELKYISFIGFKPQLSKCVKCQSDSTKYIRFDIIEGGVVCDRCFTNNFNQLSVKSDIIEIMKNLLYSKLEDLDSVKVSSAQEDKIEEVLFAYITSHIEKKYFKSLEFLKTLN